MLTHTRSSLPLMAALLVVATTAVAGLPKPVHDFYDAKIHGTTPEAFARIEPGLRAIAVGTPERQLLGDLGMEVLTKAGKPYDVRLDGYLPEISRRANGKAQDGVRYMVFGWIDGHQTLTRFAVALKDHRVVAAGPLADGETAEKLDLVQIAQASEPR